MNPLSRGLGTLVVRRVTGRKDQGGIVDPGRFGIVLEEAACSERAQAILTAFFAGFELGLQNPALSATLDQCIDPLLRPFFHEGFAMGCLPNGYLRLTSAAQTLKRFEAQLAASDPFLFLRYVGVGFWLGFQHGKKPSKVAACAQKLGVRKYAPLLHDGFGFQVGFFNHHRIAAAQPGALEPFRSLSGADRAAAANGLGRSLWFFTMDAPQRGPVLARRLGDLALDVLGGLGLAAAFTFPDDLARAYGLADSLTAAEGRHVLKGIRIALYVRHGCDSRRLEDWLSGTPMGLRERARADLVQALRVGGETMHKEDFIDAFHRGCLE